MKNWPKILLCGAALIPLTSYAAVDIKLAEDINAIVVNGEEIGYRISKLSDISLNDGTNQLVVRVAKLVMGQGGYEKFNSNPLVLTFSTANKNLTLNLVKPINTLADAQHFNGSPQLKLTEVGSGAQVELLQAELPRLQGITRDYLKELNAYNKKYDLVRVEQSSADVASALVFENSKTNTNSTAVSMVQYWFGEANFAERKEFANWAFANRSEVTQVMDTQDKPVEMMAYWYEKADKSEKSQILGWLLNQE